MMKILEVALTMKRTKTIRLGVKQPKWEREKASKHPINVNPETLLLRKMQIKCRGINTDGVKVTRVSRAAKAVRAVTWAARCPRTRPWGHRRRRASRSARKSNQKYYKYKKIKRLEQSTTPALSNTKHLIMEKTPTVRVLEEPAPPRRPLVWKTR